MKLILMRHTHADWAPGQDDHARPLSPRGQDEARRLGNWLRKSGHLPSHALVSDAKRTGQSFAALALSCPADALAELYLAEPAPLRAAINAQRNTDCLLLLAHNPGIAELASALVQTPPAHAAFYTYPPGATLVLNCDPQGGAAQLMDFTTPSDLAP
ncbi:histidine phosphatase family protein [Planktomarina temperata]|nr:histidine phosphatase family protein [Planktomarina temperata]